MADFMGVTGRCYCLAEWSELVMDDEERERRYQAADWRMRPRYEKQAEQPKRERKLDSGPREPDWDAWNRWCDSRIQTALIKQQKFIFEVIAESLAQYVGAQRQEAKRELADEVRQLRIELDQAQTLISELRSILAADRSTPIDIPSPLRPRLN